MFRVPVRGEIVMAAENVEAYEEKGFLILKLPMAKKPQPSSSGKTLIVATTSGNVTTTVKVDGKPVIVGVNAYIKP